MGWLGVGQDSWGTRQHVSLVLVVKALSTQYGLIVYHMQAHVCACRDDVAQAPTQEATALSRQDAGHTVLMWRETQP